MALATPRSLAGGGVTTTPYHYHGSQSVLLDWEAGRWSDTPPPPAVHSVAYRQMMVDLFLGLARSARPSLLSLGCGNAMVELELQRQGFDVLATDYSVEAVDLAISKGLRGESLDVLAPPPSYSYDLVYADGLLGHVAVLPDGLERLTHTMRSVVEVSGMIVLAYELSDSNTASYAVTGHAEARFFRPPAGEVVPLLRPLLPGWALQSIRIATYVRPGRGERRREIVVFHKGEALMLTDG